MWYGSCPDISHLRELGCRAWVFIMPNNLKIYNWPLKCILVGYSENLKVYCYLDKATGQIKMALQSLQKAFIECAGNCWRGHFTKWPGALIILIYNTIIVHNNTSPGSDPREN
jgi:hypothetical protein